MCYLLNIRPGSFDVKTMDTAPKTERSAVSENAIFSALVRYVPNAAMPASGSLINCCISSTDCAMSAMLFMSAR